MGGGLKSVATCFYVFPTYQVNFEAATNRQTISLACLTWKWPQQNLTWIFHTSFWLIFLKVISQGNLWFAPWLLWLSIYTTSIIRDAKNTPRHFVQILRWKGLTPIPTPFGTLVTLLDWSNNTFCFYWFMPSPLRKHSKRKGFFQMIPVKRSISLL